MCFITFVRRLTNDQACPQGTFPCSVPRQLVTVTRQRMELSRNYCSITKYIISRCVVGQERVGAAFPHLFHVLLEIELEAVSKRLVFWVCSHTFFVSTTSLIISHACSVFLRCSKGCRGGAVGCQYHFPFYVWYFNWFSQKRKIPSK